MSYSVTSAHILPEGDVPRMAGAPNGSKIRGSAPWHCYKKGGLYFHFSVFGVGGWRKGTIRYSLRMPAVSIKMVTFVKNSGTPRTIRRDTDAMKTTPYIIYK